MLLVMVTTGHSTADSADAAGTGYAKGTEHDSTD